MLGFSAAIALWAFEFGKGLAGLDHDAKEELSRLRVEVARLRSDGERATSVANTVESLLKTERAAEDQSLQADLGLFERLLPAEGEGLHLRGLQAEIEAPGELRYQLLVMQTGKASTLFSGRYDLMLTGVLDGKVWTMSLPGGPKPLQLRQYSRVEGMIDHPAEAVIKTVQARVTDTQGTVRAAQTVEL